ncbi:hypothetical protein [Fibrobacter sp. UWH4]|uniref:hypothetical protein n=1 Tax=Fibrobacter sp. UWH4 TaxID=1896210 RepID=UPI00090FAF2D|nr:hypothetical protein [Fibrobacter sp. UWH4]SHL35026.1 hypothetical protein SAMN05720762_105291 [Fibrobacter sp. UWH4]
MWSKTRQILESRLAENLKGRVSYHYDVYRTKGCKEKHDWWTEMHVLSIIVDGEAWFCTNPQFYRQYYRDGFYRFDKKTIMISSAKRGWLQVVSGKQGR